MAKARKNYTGLYVLGVIVLAVVLIFAFTGGFSQTSIRVGGGTTSNGGSCTGSTISPSITDAISNGGVSASFSGRVDNGGNKTITSSTSLPQGSTVELLGSASGYLNTLFPNKITLTKCGPNAFNGEMYAYSAPALTILTSPGQVTVTNSSTGGAVNLTSPSAGGVLQFGLQILGTDKKTTGDMLVLVEANSSVSSMTLNGVSGVIKKPSTYTTHVTSNSQVFEFDLPAQKNAKPLIYSGVATMKSGQTYSGALWITVEGKQAFLDNTGNYVASGVETTDGQTAEQAYTQVAVAYVA